MITHVKKPTPTSYEISESELLAVLALYCLSPPRLFYSLCLLWFSLNVCTFNGRSQAALPFQSFLISYQPRCVPQEFLSSPPRSRCRPFLSPTSFKKRASGFVREPRRYYRYRQGPLNHSKNTLQSGRQAGPDSAVSWTPA